MVSIVQARHIGAEARVVHEHVQIITQPVAADVVIAVPVVAVGVAAVVHGAVGIQAVVFWPRLVHITKEQSRRGLCHLHHVQAIEIQCITTADIPLSVPATEAVL